MGMSEANREAGAKAAGKRPWFLTPEVERVMAITMAVAQELAVTRKRCDTLERLLEAKGVLTRDEIEQYAPAPDVATERALDTQAYIARILRIVQQENEALRSPGDIASEEVAVEVSREA